MSPCHRAGMAQPEEEAGTLSNGRGRSPSQPQPYLYRPTTGSFWAPLPSAPCPGAHLVCWESLLTVPVRWMEGPLVGIRWEAPCLQVSGRSRSFPAKNTHVIAGTLAAISTIEVTLGIEGQRAGRQKEPGRLVALRSAGLSGSLSHGLELCCGQLGRSLSPPDTLGVPTGVWRGAVPLQWGSPFSDDGQGLWALVLPRGCLEDVCTRRAPPLGLPSTSCCW